MANRIQIGYPAVIKAVAKPKPIEIGKIDRFKATIRKKIWMKFCLSIRRVFTEAYNREKRAQLGKWHAFKVWVHWQKRKS